MIDQRNRLAADGNVNRMRRRLRSRGTIMVRRLSALGTVSLVGALTAATGAVCQTTTSSTQPGAARVAPAVVDPARIAKAERVLDVIHIDRQYDSIFSRLTPIITVQVFTALKDNVRLPASVRTRLADPAELATAERIFAEETVKGFKTRYIELRTATAREYAAAFSAAELDQLATFYESPLGQKTLSVLPTLQAKLMPIGMAAGAQVGQEAIRRTFERMNFEPKGPKA